MNTIYSFETKSLCLLDKSMHSQLVLSEGQNAVVKNGLGRYPYEAPLKFEHIFEDFCASGL